MDALTQLLPALSSTASLGSTGYNLYNQYKNQQYQDMLRSYAQNPAKMNAYAEQFTQPLNAGLQSSVANQSQAYLAERGLSDSPAISQQVESQALAPYIQQNQQQGYQDALQALGLGGGAIPPGQQQATGINQLAKIFANSPNTYSQGQSVLNMATQYDPNLANYPTSYDPGYTIPDQDLQDWYAQQPAAA